MEPAEAAQQCILITSAGRRVELLRTFRDAASSLGVAARLIACDVRPQLSAACHDADDAFTVPPAGDPGYADALLDLCRSQGVSLVIPTIDPELLPISEQRARFEAIGAWPAVSDPALVAMAGDKLATARFFTQHRIPGPRTETIESALADPGTWRWPVFAKAQRGSASRGAQIVATPARLGLLEPDEPLVVQDLLAGEEYTVNLFFDRAGALRCAVPHWRIQTRAGEVEKGVTRRVAALQAIAERLAQVLPGPRGALCFQAMVAPDGTPSVIEINARFGGGYPLAHRAGAHFARWLIEERLGRPASAGNAWRENLTMLRWDAATFVERDEPG